MAFYTAVLTGTLISGLSLYLKLFIWIWKIEPLLSIAITLIIYLVVVIVYQLSKTIARNETPT